MIYLAILRTSLFLNICFQFFGVNVLRIERLDHMVGLNLMLVNSQIHFQIGSIILHSYQHCMIIPDPTSLPQNLISLTF